MFTIRSKLFIAILLSLMLIIASLAAMIHIDVKHGFINYLGAKEKHALNQLVQPLTDYYAQTGNWQSLQSHPEHWKSLLAAQLRMASMQHHATNDKLLLHRDKHGDKHSDYLLARIFLLDAEDNLVMGNLISLPPRDLLPLSYQGKTIGYLGMVHRQGLTEKIELEFISGLLERLGWILLVMLLIAISLALWLARHFGQPIAALRQASHQLASGNYATRIDSHGGDELALLSHDFNILAERLEQNEIARKQWIADIAHELRTPLTILRGEVEALQDGINLPTQSSFVSLHQEVSQLQRLVDDLYQLAMSDSGTLSYQMQPIDLLELLKESSASHISQFNAKSLLLRTDQIGDEPVWILGDEQRLKQLIHNLLENSLRYTDSPGQVFIRTTQENQQVQIVFEDSSPSVPEEALTRLFERLYRVESSRNRATGGAGLGLSICHNIVRAHQGQIDATHSDLGGVAIHIQFPIISGK
jgi:two-component system sensor histidine kinase BaeS